MAAASADSIPKTVQNSVVRLSIIDGVVISEFHGTEHLGLKEAESAVNLRHQFQNYIKMPLLADITQVKSVTKESRDFFSSEYAIHYISAGALLVNNSLFTMTLANIFFKLSTPAVPHKMFSDREKAIRWLKKYR